MGELAVAIGASDVHFALVEPSALQLEQFQRVRREHGVPEDRFTLFRGYFRAVSSKRHGRRWRKGPRRSRASRDALWGSSYGEAQLQALAYITGIPPAEIDDALKSEAWNWLWKNEAAPQRVGTLVITHP